MCFLLEQARFDQLNPQDDGIREHLIEWNGWEQTSNNALTIIFGMILAIEEIFQAFEVAPSYFRMIGANRHEEPLMPRTVLLICEAS